jgi:hypothetical protein
VDAAFSSGSVDSSFGGGAGSCVITGRESQENSVKRAATVVR